jgi:HlyD family secretion protein
MKFASGHAMRHRLLLILCAVIVVTVSVTAYYRSSGEKPALYATAQVTRGDLVETVEATGTLQAVTTVQVGTQVSGTIKALHADFNSIVKNGQVIAELEPSLFQAQVDQARASLSKLQADVERARVEVDDTQVKLSRAQELWKQQLIARTDLETAETAARQAEAALRSAQAQVEQGRATLNQAQVNLAHTIIRAPIDGVVISRSVDVGQTVAASMQAPTLFVIANDLTRMQVNASVDESDIGKVKAGEPVTFKVDAYPEQTFTGTVSQVRLQPQTSSNVVSYITLIDVPNPEQQLKPGMTATVTINVASAENVLRVPTAALRFRGSAQHPRVWVLQNGQPRPVAVEPGITSGALTAIVGEPVPEGSEVITAQTNGQTTTRSGSPLLPFGGRRGGGARQGTGGAAASRGQGTGR